MEATLIKKMVEAATDAIKQFGDGQNHTISAAVATKDGKIVTGINVYHFTGGPCGEIVAVGSAVSQGIKDLVAIVVVGDRDRGVLSPCGRCRQVLFDYYPNLQVLLAKEGSYVAKPIRDLLPDIYDWNKYQDEGISE